MFTPGLTNAISNAIYGTNPLRSAREAFLRGAATSGINYLSDVMGSGNRLIRDPRLDCGGTDPFDPSLGYHSDRGYRYDTPQSESSRKTFSMWDFLGEVVMGGLTGGFTSAAFYGAGKGIERLKEGVRSNRGERGGRNAKIYSPQNVGKVYKGHGEVIGSIPINKPNGIYSGNSSDPYHYINRVTGRNISATNIYNTIKKPTAVLSQWEGKRFLYVGDNAAVVLSNKGELITVWSRSDFGVMLEQILKEAH